MTETNQEVLSSDELDAVLATFADRDRQPDGAGASKRTVSTQRAAVLARPLRDFADEQGRTLSTLHQRAIRFVPFRSEALPSGEFVGTMTADDRVALIEFLPGGEVGALLIGRSLLYGWLTMALGGPSGTPLAIPDRPYSPIEQRFFRGIAQELAQRLQESLAETRAVEIQVRDVIEPHLVPGAIAPRLVVASFDVEGVGDVARLRVALPDSWVDGLQVRKGNNQSQSRNEMRAQLDDMPVSLHAEVGSVELSVRRVAALKPGDVIPLEPVEGGGVLVRLEDRPKFRAVPGAVGRSLAVQLLEEVK